ncbi:MAG TPA: FAD-dependent oxidoreductase [Acidimicrobiia bacterium]|jgi:NADPH-dependent glutamate synthase beta subunit-like oxidoreductase
MSLAELHFYDENIPCLAACPVNTNAGMYVAAIADGNDELAYLTARLPNPFASVCGRVCAAPCEDACRRGQIDRPIAIRALKRFVTEKYGTESANGRSWEKVTRAPEGSRTESIGIIGGGPAGLACAHDLRRWGYQVTVYEATDRLGGAMWLGIPEYRLDRSVLQGDIDAIVDLGVEVRYDTRLGVDVTFEELRERHDALFIGIGATLGRGIDIEGNEADGVFKAIEFLINMNRGFEVEVGERVVVIGGGDVAMDAARTALRAAEYADTGVAEPATTAEPEQDTATLSIDAARSAARAGARNVTVISLESPEEMPAHEFEIDEAQNEGISFVHRRGPARILSSDGRVTGLETIGVRSVFDEEGRFAPVFDGDDLQTLDTDTVILAIGQAIDLDALGTSGPEIGPRRTIGIDVPTGRTSLDGVWSGGDAANGPRTLIDAIADGRRSAADIHRSFGGEIEEASKGHMVQLDQFHRLTDTFDRWERVEIPTVPTGRRIGLAEVELGFTEEQARHEANRCLRCFANIQLDVHKCVLCALCVDVCPLDLISLVPAAEIGETIGGATGSALILDESKCIRCALCIERCPPNALSMGVWNGVGVPAWT